MGWGTPGGWIAGVQQAQAASYQKMLAEKRASAMRAAKRASSVFAAANKAREAGDTRIAGLLFTRVAATRRAAEGHREDAQRALLEMQTDARGKLSRIERRLEDLRSYVGFPTLKPVGSEETDSEDDVRAAGIIEAFEKLEQLSREYNTVPGVNKQIGARLAKLRKKTHYAEVLNQPYAKVLWDQGQELEDSNELCCAFLMYEEAVTYLPAPAAHSAQERLNELKADPQNIEAAQRCLTIRECQELYARALRLEKGTRKTDLVQELFREVVDTAPEDSEVHKAAVERLASR